MEKIEKKFVREKTNPEHSCIEYMESEGLYVDLIQEVLRDNKMDKLEQKILLRWLRRKKKRI